MNQLVINRFWTFSVIGIIVL